MERNIFIDLASKYYDKLCLLYKENVYPTKEWCLIPEKKKLFGPSNEDILRKAREESDDIKRNIKWNELCAKTTYEDMSKLWNHNTCSFNEWILLVKDYIDFIRYSEKCFMYKNESSIDREKSNIVVYCEDSSNILYIRDFYLDIKIKIEFIESLVNDIIIDATQSNSILDYVESGKAPKKQINVEFVHITISREWGKQLVNEFRFIISENPKYNDISDEQLMDAIQTVVGESLKVKLYEIFDNNITELARYKKIKLEGIVNGELLFKRY